MYKSTKELEDNSILIDSEEAANKADEWLKEGRTVWCVGRNSLGVIIHFHLPFVPCPYCAGSGMREDKEAVEANDEGW